MAKIPDINKLTEREITCTSGQLYEVVIIGLKKRLSTLQKNRINIKRVERERHTHRYRELDGPWTTLMRIRIRHTMRGYG
jgi:hypothetical protein